MNLKFQTEEKGQRIDKYLCEQTQLTRSRIQQLIEQGAVEVNGKATKSNYKINPGYPLKPQCSVCFFQQQRFEKVLQSDKTT